MGIEGNGWDLIQVPSTIMPDDIEENQERPYVNW
jgi:hypothetical protein